MLRLPRALRVYNQLSSSSETNLLSEVYRRSGRRCASHCPAGDPRALFRGERSRGSCHRRPAVPGRQGHWVGGWHSPGWAGVPIRAGPRQPRQPFARPERRSACAQSPTEGTDETLLRVFMACPPGKVPSLSPVGLLRPYLLSGSSGGRREGLGAAQPRAHGDGAQPLRSGRRAAGRRSCVPSISGLSLT